MESETIEVIYQGNSIISVETLPDFPHPVIVKKPAKPHASRQQILSLEKECELTLALDAIEGVRKAIEQQLIENQPVLIIGIYRWADPTGLVRQRNT
ncbi:MAG TPA: hypothetical protein VLE70_06470 [Anaerolineae bacterium]|jgi:hypothetical protein|nr:hypothetical protein [Anaerolineae bacterium]